MPMLGNRNRRAAVEVSAPSTAEVDLPPYEPLGCALSEEAKRALAALGKGGDTRRYQDHIKKSLGHIGKNVAALNDRLLERQAELDGLIEKRTTKGTEKSTREEQLEAWIPKLEAEVTSLSMNSESALRDLVDRQAKLQDDTAATATMAAHFQNLPSREQPARRRQTNAEGGEDADEAEQEELPPPEQDPLAVLEEQRLAKSAKYDELDYYQKYSLNNDYAAFRKLWHDARFGDREVLLQDPSQWIDAGGNPVLVEKQRTNDNDAEDEDLVIEGEHHSYVCPLSMQQITEPFSNKKCRHTFQKQSIVQWFNEPGYRGRSRQCPEPGCEVVSSLCCRPGSVAVGGIPDMSTVLLSCRLLLRRCGYAEDPAHEKARGTGGSK